MTPHRCGTRWLLKPAPAVTPSGPGVGPAMGRECPPLKNCTYQDFRDPADLHRAYQRLNPHTRDFINLAPGRSFRHWVGSVMLNEIPLFAGITTPTRVVVGDSADLLLVVMSAGTLELSGPAFTVNSNAGGIVLAPVAGSELKISGERCAITLRPAAIARAAAVMAGRRSGVTRRERQRFEQPKPVALPAGHPQATVMQQLIRTIDACLAAGPQVAMRLGLDDQLQR